MRTLLGKCKAQGAVLGACGLLLAAGTAQGEITRVTAKADITVRTLEDGEIVDEEVFSLQFPRQTALLPLQVAVNFIPPDIPTGEDLFAAEVAFRLTSGHEHDDLVGSLRRHFPFDIRIDCQPATAAQPRGARGACTTKHKAISQALRGWWGRRRIGRLHVRG